MEEGYTIIATGQLHIKVFSVVSNMELDTSNYSSSSPSPPSQSYPAESTVSPTETSLGLEFNDSLLRGKSKTFAKPVKDKICLVCGDKALGYNFNAVTCESCKAFFRRNAFKEIRGRCEGKCEVTVESRSYCKRCRLQKCFTVGMKRDLILNDVQRQVRKQKIQENRLRRQGLPVPAVADSVEMGGPSSSTSSASGGSPSASTSGTVQIKSEPEEVSISHQIAAEVDPHSYEGLNERSRQLLDEVRKAFQLSFDCPMERQAKAAPSSTDFLNMADSSVRRLVKMAKHIDAFRKLDQDDQISLLKGSVVEVLIMRSSKMFDTQSMGWMVVKGGMPQNVSAAGLQFGNNESISFFQQYHRFATSLLAATRRDNVILMLMIVMTVLSPDRETLKTKEAVAQAQEIYAQILQEYIAFQYPGDELIFAKVLQKLADIRELNETHTQMLMHMKVDELEPLIVEIFDMSS